MEETTPNIVIKVERTITQIFYGKNDITNCSKSFLKNPDKYIYIYFDKLFLGFIVDIFDIQLCLYLLLSGPVFRFKTHQDYFHY